MTEAPDKFGLVLGAAVIVALLGITERRAFHMLEAGALPARKVSGRRMASRHKLEQHFEESAA